MTEAIQNDRAVGRKRFCELTGRIQSLVGQGLGEEIETVIADYIRENDNQVENSLLEGVRCFLRQDNEAVVGAMVEAGQQMSEQEYPAVGSIYSNAFIQGQLALPRRVRGATEKGYRFFKNNIEVLGKIDPELADEIRECDWPADYVLIEYWSGLHLFCASRNSVQSLADDVRVQLEKAVVDRGAIGFGGICTGQELRFFLEHQFRGLHGMTRAHYVFEEDAQQLKMLLHLYDLSEVLLSRELIIFGASGMEKSFKEIFGTFRYMPPNITIGNIKLVQGYMDKFDRDVQSQDFQDKVRVYYSSDEFKRRQKMISEGQLQPRILVDTCRWTTFLKYCAADFAKAFDQLGCETRYLIEENDVQAMLPAMNWRQLNEFKPDAVFMISHARPTIPYFPRELPFIGFIQDRCGPLWALQEADIISHLSSQDLFICLVKEFQEYLLTRKVPRKQTFIMPVPADEQMFYPLEAGHPLAERFSCDISYVKHGMADTDAVMARWLITTGLADGVQSPAGEFFKELYEEIRRDPARRWPEHQLHELIERSFGPQTTPETTRAMHQTMTSFAVEVYTACRRRYYLEELAEQGLSFRLYGNDWHADRIFQRKDGGPVARDSELNAVYNFSKINLHLQPYASMHQRLSECGLAVGFMMVSDIPKEQDWGPARNYFEADKEIVFFDTKEELVDRCRYYLEHKDKRLEIAQNMHKRARRERTVIAGAKTVLEKWRELLMTTQDSVIKYD